MESSKADKVTQAFVEANIASIRPDGLKALDVAVNALDDISSMLAQFVQYWQSTCESCRLYILNGSINIKPAEAVTFAAKWRADRVQLEAAILIIAKSCDAVLVEAVGAPPPRPPTPPCRGGALQPSGRGTRLTRPRREKTLPAPPVPPRPTDSKSGGSGFGMGFFMWG